MRDHSGQRMDCTIFQLCRYSFHIKRTIESELERGHKTPRDKYLDRILRLARDEYSLDTIGGGNGKFFLMSSTSPGTTHTVTVKGDDDTVTCTCSCFAKHANSSQSASRTCKHCEAVKLHVLQRVPAPKRIAQPQAHIGSVVLPDARREHHRLRNRLAQTYAHLAALSKEYNELVAASDTRELPILRDSLAAATNAMIQLGGEGPLDLLIVPPGKNRICAHSQGRLLCRYGRHCGTRTRISGPWGLV